MDFFLLEWDVPMIIELVDHSEIFIERRPLF